MTDMQPENSHQGPNLEHIKAAPAVEGGEKIISSSPETAGIETNAPKTEQTAEASAARADAVAISTSLPSTTGVASTSDVDDTTSPAIAADDDVIEKEWVDSSKKIVSETQGDPHSRSHRVNKLHADYLKKRFGKELNPVESKS
ncbi:MAG TPA: hypothetical protein PLY16_02645 [Candidatus Saccharibacteria bacterium]|nr:hypothetical protein [Candidatus Saccharibacteria bacterium]